MATYNNKPKEYWDNLEKKEEKLGEKHNACKKKMCETEELRKEKEIFKKEEKLKCDGIEEGYAKCSDPIYEKSKYKKLFQEYVKCGKKDNVCAKERAKRQKVQNELDAYYMTPEGQAYLKDNIKAIEPKEAKKTKKNKKGGGAYHITNYTYKQAKRIGVIVKPSTDPTKKIDVYKKDKKNKKGTLKKIASVGAAGMNDFPTYIQKRGLAFAKTRRRLYKMRHEKDRKTKWTRGWLADKLLW
jgi:hypothetical protein